MVTLLALFALVSGITLYEVKKDVDMYEKSKTAIVRHSTPHKYDQLPFGTELVVIKGKSSFELYQQVSKDQDNPHWEKMGNLVCQEQ